MKFWQTSLGILMGIFIVFLSGCAFNAPTERYISPHVEGLSQKINLEAVEKAFWQTKASDFNTWMAAFEKRVNEIYDGSEVVSIDATKKSGRLVITGYIDKQKKQGYVEGDDKLFSIEQTGDAVNNEMPYRVAGQNGNTYYEGRHSILDNPFLQMMLISHMMNGWGGHYYTPPQRTTVLYDYRNTYRNSPSWGQQEALNRSFDSRFKSKAMGGGLQSTRSFGGTSFASDTASKNRVFGGGFSNSGQSNSQSNSWSSSNSSMWGGRRSSGSSFFGGFRSSGRSWGGRRR